MLRDAKRNKEKLNEAMGVAQLKQTSCRWNISADMRDKQRVMTCKSVAAARNTRVADMLV